MINPCSWPQRFSAWRLSHSTMSYRIALASRNKTSRRRLALLARDPHPDVRLAVASRDHVPFQLHELLAFDTDKAVRVALTSQDLDVFVQGRMARDEAWEVRRGLLTCPTLTYATLVSLLGRDTLNLRDADLVARLFFAWDHHDETLVSFCRTNEGLARAVLFHERCPTSIALKLVAVADARFGLFALESFGHEPEVVSAITATFSKPLFGEPRDDITRHYANEFRRRYVAASAVSDATVANFPAALVAQAAPWRLVADTDRQDPELAGVVAALAHENQMPLAKVRQSARLLTCS